MITRITNCLVALHVRDIKSTLQNVSSNVLEGTLRQISQAAYFVQDHVVENPYGLAAGKVFIVV